MECTNCGHRVPIHAVKYLLSDLDSELLAWVEENLKNEVTESSFLCGECFESLTKRMWSETHEPEVIPTQMDVEGDDPLSQTEIKIEDPCIKEELDKDESDLPVEIDNESTEIGHEEEEEEKVDEDLELTIVFETTENIKHQTKEEKESPNKNVDNDSDFEWSMKQETEETANQNTYDVSSSDSDSNASKDDSDDSWVPKSHQKNSNTNDKIARPESPPILDGSRLPWNTKCDNCSTVITKKQYQKLPDGPEKILIALRGRREVSPERVCCACWKKVHTEATHKLKKRPEPERRTLDETTKYIEIPGCQRASNSSRRCVVKRCKSKGAYTKTQVPVYLRKLLFTDYNIFLSQHCRMCSEHRKEFNKDWTFLKKQGNIEVFNAVEVEMMLDFLREEALKLPD